MVDSRRKMYQVGYRDGRRETLKYLSNQLKKARRESDSLNVEYVVNDILEKVKKMEDDQ